MLVMSDNLAANSSSVKAQILDPSWLRRHDAAVAADTLRALRFTLREEDHTPWHVLDRIEELEFEATQESARMNLDTEMEG
jgi:hypothetical protein